MLIVSGVSVAIEGASILSEVSLAAAAGEVVVVLGPSGSGKSTLLRVIAGLQQPTAGKVLWDGHDLAATPPHARRFGLMFQDLALFPHLDVRGNVAFGLEGGSDRTVSEALDLVGLSDMAHRRIDTLSGGERQRVALARTLAPGPRLLMLDEPLGSLDRVLRERLTGDLRLIFDGLEAGVIYVTHDQSEALAIADRVVILHDGRVQQAGEPEDLWMRPASEFVARFVGWTAFADATAGNGHADTPWGTVATSAEGPIRVGLAPGAARLDRAGPLHAIVDATEFAGTGYEITLRPSIGPIVRVRANQRLEPGTSVRWVAEPGGIAVFRR